MLRTRIETAHDHQPFLPLHRPGGTIAFDDTGAGPLVVMLPGLGDLRRQYRLLVPAIAAAGMRAVSVDLRGHGDSSVGWDRYDAEASGGDLVALLEALDAGPAAVVGNSFGAAIAVHAAAERPDLVAGLVLIGPFVRHHDRSWPLRLAIHAMTTGPWRVAAWGRFYDSLYTRAKPSDHAQHRSALLANLREPGRFDAVRGMLARDDRAIEARLPIVRAASLVVMGSADPDFPDPRAEAALVAEALRGDVHMVAGAGHYPHVEAPDATNPAIVSFAQRVLAPRTQPSDATR